jgi:dCTP deaminase
VEFALLARPVDRPYVGQHGYETEIWPIPAHHYADESTLRAQGIKPESTEELERMYGLAMADLARRLGYYERKVWVHLGFTVLAFAGLFTIAGQVRLIWSVLLGVAANLLTTFGFWVFGRRHTAYGPAG